MGPLTAAFCFDCAHNDRQDGSPAVPARVTIEPERLVPVLKGHLPGGCVSDPARYRGNAV